MISDESSGYIIGGGVMAYALLMIPQVLAFRFTNTSNLYNLGAQLWEANTMPMVKYSRMIQAIGTFIYPNLTLIFTRIDL
ncbi:ABC-2 family transporter protein [Paenibacillus tarimensis]